MSLKDKAWEEVQIKAFTHWVNSYMPNDKKITNLTADFGDGLRLILLVEGLTNKKQQKKYNKAPKTRVHFIENCHLALMQLKESKVKQNISFGAEDFADGNLKLILGFLWFCLRTFRVGMVEGQEDKPFEDGLMAWLKETLAEYNLTIKDFTSSFEDGQILLALMHKYDNSFVDMTAIDPSKKLENVTQAFKTAEEKVGVPQLIEPTTLAGGEADERSMVLYVSLIQHAFVAQQKLREQEQASDATKKSFTSKVQQLEAELAEERTQREELKSLCDQLRKELDETKAELEKQRKLNAELTKKNQELEAENNSLKSSGDSLKEKGSYLSEKIDVMKQLLQQETDEKTELQSTKDKLEKDIKSLQREKGELESERDHFKKDKEALEAEQKVMLEAMERWKAAKKKLEAEYSERSDLNLKGLDSLRKNLLEHLNDMNTWKKYLEQDREYKSENIQIVTEKAIQGQSFEDQLAVLNKELSGENSRLQKLLQDREIEERSKDGDKAPAAGGDEKKKESTSSSSKKKDDKKK